MGCDELQSRRGGSTVSFLVVSGWMMEKGESLALGMSMGFLMLSCGTLDTRW